MVKRFALSGALLAVSVAVPFVTCYLADKKIIEMRKAKRGK